MNYLELHATYSGLKNKLRVIETFELEKRLQIRSGGKWRDISKLSKADYLNLVVNDAEAHNFIIEQRAKF